MKAPQARPCGSCPYRKDVPSGVWSPDEYAKLPPYDLPTPEQPAGMFACHQQDGHLCAGWVGCHDMDESLSLRLGVAFGYISSEDCEATLEYESPIPLFESGLEAAEHGLRDLDEPGEKARRAIRNLLRKGVGEVD